MRVSDSQIIFEEWEKGSDVNKRRLQRYRLLVETFAYSCMARVREELRGVEGEK